MKKLNALKDNFFLDRFLGFIERYDEVSKTNMIYTASKWVKDKDFDAIYYCLKLFLPDSMVCLSHVELANMTEEELFALQEFSKKMAPLLDEEKALYHELCGYMGKITS